MSSDSRSVWWEIQSLRHSPPGRARDGQRQHLFLASLDQALELFRAAEAVSAAARPIPLFYGLSQAGRALAAAHDGEESPLRGHGIKADQLNGPLDQITLRDSGQGAFTRLAQLLESDSLPKPVEWGAIYAALPAVVEQIADVGEQRLPALRVIPERLDASEAGVMTINHLASGWVLGLPKAVIAGTDMRQELKDFLRHYPSMSGWKFPSTPEHPIPQKTIEGKQAVKISWSTEGEGGAGESHRQRRIRRVHINTPDGQRWILPAFSRGRKLQAPLITWWAVCYALSMLARYEPSAWLSHLNLDASPNAVPLEALMEVGLTEIPKHILQALKNPEGWRTNRPLLNDPS